MKQAILVQPREIQIYEKPMPSVEAHDVLVRVHACGVCASELHAWEGDAGRYPRELGHEVAGEVIEVGNDVCSLAPGARVTGLFHRGFAEYAVAPENRVVALPESLSYESGIGEPIACIVSAALRTRVELGDTVALIGLGFMGLLMLQAIRLKGPARIICIDLRDDVRELARRFGADRVLHPTEVGEELTVRRGSAPDRGVDVAIETTGTQPGLTLAGQMVREHGMLSILGYHQGGPRTVDMELWNWKALDVLNAHERRMDHKAACMRRGIALVAAGRIDVVPLITHRFGLDQVDDAFRALQEKPAGFKKAMVLPTA